MSLINGYCVFEESILNEEKKNCILVKCVFFLSFAVFQACF